MSRALYLLSRIYEAKRGKGPVYTISQLTEAVNNRGEPRPVAIIRTTPLMGNKTLTIKAEAMGKKLYPMTVTFYNVDYSWEQDGAHPLKVRPELGKTAYMTPVSEGGNPVQLRCQCPDFRHTYAHFDKQEKALSGSPFPFYQRKTENRPERNPQKRPGVCKHLIGLFERLRRDRILS